MQLPRHAVDVAEGSGKTNLDGVAGSIAFLSQWPMVRLSNKTCGLLVGSKGIQSLYYRFLHLLPTTRKNTSLRSPG